MTEAAVVAIPRQLERAEVVRMNDSLTNFVTGIGTSRDKNYTNVYVFNELTPEDCENAYRGDWVARKGIDIPAADATRQWRAWQAEGDQIEELEKAERLLCMKQRVRRTLQFARLYGGGALILGVDGQGDPDRELVPEKVKKGHLKFVHAVSRWQITTGQLDLNPMSPYFGQPEYYERQIQGGQPMRIHPSRVIRLIGNQVPDELRLSEAWGDSVLNAVDEAIKNVSLTSNGLSQLVHELKIDIIKIPTLMANLSTQEYSSKLIERFKLANIAKSNINALLLDKEEEWNRVTATLAGVSDVLMAYVALACAAFDIPATRFLGQSPNGMNATGESDTRNYYDRIKADQEDNLTPALDRLDEMLIRSTFGTRDENIYYEWNDLWQMTEAERADIAVKKATVFKADVDAAMLPADALSKARINQLIEDGTYPGLELAIEESEQDIMREENLSREQENLEAERELAAANTNESPDEDEDEELPNMRAARDAYTADRKTPSLFVKVGPNKYKRRGGKGKIYNYEQVKLYYALYARGQAWDSVADAQPRSLYVRRDVLNADAIIAWAKEQGFTNVYPAEQMHVTIAFSKSEVDWMKVGEAWGSEGGDDEGRLIVKPGGVRLVERLGQQGEAVVLMFTSSALSWRHESIKNAGASWDYEDYQPHITISMDAPEIDVKAIEPYRGEIVLGPEIFEEVNENWREKVKHDHTPGGKEHDQDKHGNRAGGGSSRNVSEWDGEKDWLHGTSVEELNYDTGEALYLTQRPDEAKGFASRRHLGGRGNKPTVMEIELRPGKIRNIDDELLAAMDNGDDLDSTINAIISQERDIGYTQRTKDSVRYLDFTHPGFAGEDFKARVALYPGMDVKVKSIRRVTDAATLTKVEVNFREGNADQKCGICKHFIEPNRCELVMGMIGEEDLCDLFAPAIRGDVEKPKRKRK